MKRILIVDDEEKIRRIYKELLIAEGYDVIYVSNAVEANELIKQKPIDLILLDINMPEVDGSLFYQLIDMFHKKSKVIVCSVHSLEDQRKIIEKAAGYYDKSQGIDILRKKVKKVLGDGS